MSFLNIDWSTQPYSHSGRWEKKINSIMSPGDKVTWPQFVAEMVIYWRTKYWKDYKDIRQGKGWHSSISKHVRDLNQQAANICNYFPFPDDEPLVIYAFKKFFRERKPTKIGQFRKTRVKKSKNGRETSNLTQDEKDVVLGITNELKKAIKTRDSYTQVQPVVAVSKASQDIKFDSGKVAPKKGSLSYLIALENQIKSETSNNE